MDGGFPDGQHVRGHRGSDPGEGDLFQVWITRADTQRSRYTVHQQDDGRGLLPPGHQRHAHPGVQPQVQPRRAVPPGPGQAVEGVRRRPPPGLGAVPARLLAVHEGHQEQVHGVLSLLHGLRQRSQFAGGHAVRTSTEAQQITNTVCQCIEREVADRFPDRKRPARCCTKPSKKRLRQPPSRRTSDGRRPRVVVHAKDRHPQQEAADQLDRALDHRKSVISCVVSDPQWPLE